jgi:DnaJ-class molecular chaperone
MSDDCTTCDGMGVDDEDPKMDCPDCIGTGDLHGQCRTCIGEGLISVSGRYALCDECGGEGLVPL